MPLRGPDTDIHTGPPLDGRLGSLPSNLVALVDSSVRRNPDKVAMRWKDGPAAEMPGWHAWTYAELWAHVVSLSLALRSMGLGRGDRVLVVSRSRPEWAVVDLACLALGAVICPVFHGESASRTAQIVERVQPSLAFVEGAAERALLPRSASSQGLRRVITFEASGASEAADSFPSLAEGRPPEASAIAAWREGWQGIGPADLATIVHIVDGTGAIHGAELTHGNVLHNAAAVIQALPLRPNEVVLSVLPMSHMLERATGLYVPLWLGATVAYAERGGQRWTRSLREIRPTALVGVPLLFDRLADEVRAGMERRSGVEKSMTKWALRVGERAARARGRWGIRPLLWLEGIAADVLVGRRVRAQLGGRLRLFASGGAALSPETGAFLFGLGIRIAEGYGLTETSPVLTLNRLEAPRFGTVGYPVAETELRIDPATGEILARGPPVMRAYHRDPVETARVIDGEGWFHTGDVGAFDDHGALVITGRIKQLIVLSTGKKVSPRPLEEALRASPFILDATLLGDDEPATRAVVTPDASAIERAHMTSDAAIQGLIEREAESRLAAFARYERPRRVEVLPPVHRSRAGRGSESIATTARGAVLPRSRDAR